MIISAVFSKPSKQSSKVFEHPYVRIKIKAENDFYFLQAFTETQVFHKKISEQELNKFIEEHAGKTFKNCVIKTENEEKIILSGKKGKSTTLIKKICSRNVFSQFKNTSSNFQSLNRKKNYIIQEGNPVPFLILLGIMTSEGKIICSKYNKFRQINRFLEFINDILPDVKKTIEISDEQKDDDFFEKRPIRITDFGCGKSYLTFALYYFLNEIKGINTEITGLDLKKDVVENCRKIAEKLDFKKLTFAVGNIAQYNHKYVPDIVISLHACDTATDFALEYAVKNRCKAILTVPCCQHEINYQLDGNIKNWKMQSENKDFIDYKKPFFPLLKYGIIKEKFASLVTDSLRAAYLENAGYDVQVMEFIDAENTPKNILIRAVNLNSPQKETALKEAAALTNILEIEPSLKRLLKI